MCYSFIIETKRVDPCSPFCCVNCAKQMSTSNEMVRKIKKGFNGNERNVLRIDNAPQGRVLTEHFRVEINDSNQLKKRTNWKRIDKEIRFSTEDAFFWLVFTRFNSFGYKTSNETLIAFRFCWWTPSIALKIVIDEFTHIYTWSTARMFLALKQMIVCALKSHMCHWATLLHHQTGDCLRNLWLYCFYGHFSCYTKKQCRKWF